MYPERQVPRQVIAWLSSLNEWLTRRPQRAHLIHARLPLGVYFGVLCIGILLLSFVLFGYFYAVELGIIGQPAHGQNRWERETSNVQRAADALEFKREEVILTEAFLYRRFADAVQAGRDSQARVALETLLKAAGTMSIDLRGDSIPTRSLVAALKRAQAWGGVRGQLR